MKLVIKELKQCVELGRRLNGFWYRGHTTVVGSLIPRVNRGFNISNEKYYIQEFCRYGPSIIDNFPKGNLEILFLMQHYGLPTRLLDWTENILIALFFIVYENRDEDGELWFMNPMRLDQNSEENINIDNIYKYLITEPFHNDKMKLLEELKLKDIKLNLICISPPYIDKRISAQQSTFTLHPNRHDKHSEITEILKSPNQIAKITIPSVDKERLERDLNNFGISYRTVFPDLEGLSKHIIKHQSSNWMTGSFDYDMKTLLNDLQILQKE